MKPQRVQFLHWLEDHSMHVLLKVKGVKKKGCASSIVSDIIRVSKTIGGRFLFLGLEEKQP